MDIRLLNEKTVETVCLLSKRKPDTTVRISIDMGDYKSSVKAQEKGELYRH